METLTVYTEGKEYKVLSIIFVIHLEYTYNISCYTKNIVEIDVDLHNRVEFSCRHGSVADCRHKVALHDEN